MGQQFSVELQSYICLFFSLSLCSQATAYTYTRAWRTSDDKSFYKKEQNELIFDFQLGFQSPVRSPMSCFKQ